MASGVVIWGLQHPGTGLEREAHGLLEKSLPTPQKLKDLNADKKGPAIARPLMFRRSLTSCNEMLCHGLTTQNINKQKQTQPDDINKMPVPSRSFKAEAIIRLKVTFDRTEQHDQEHERANGHVGAMKAS